MLDCLRMPEEWIVRVQDKEYGPVDLETLRDWKQEGRLLPSNEVRQVDVDLWTTADQIPGLFPRPQSTETLGVLAGPKSFPGILSETWRIYHQGFWQFFFLTALVAIPAICGELSSVAAGSPNAEIDLRTFLAASFNFCMFVLSLAAWPLYIAGIQILTNELSHGRSVETFDLFRRAARFWSRVMLLCVFVYGVFILLIAFGFAILLLAATASSLFSALITLLLLAVQVWMFARFFANVLFWQQFAVLADSDLLSALRQSKKLAHSRSDLPWHSRPLWRGAMLASIWLAFVILLTVAVEWSTLTQYLREAMTVQDPQAWLQSLVARSKTAGFNAIGFALNLLQVVLRPLLGIAFVLLYLQSRTDHETDTTS
jgi:hypothetical protein